MTNNLSFTFPVSKEDLLPAEEIAKACISVLDTAPDVLVIIFIYNIIPKELLHIISYFL